MQKIAVIGDVHITGKNPRCRKDIYLDSILTKLDQILSSNDIVLCLGDLFDSASVEEEAVSRFLKLVIKHNKPFYTIFGNHDLYKYSTQLLEKTSLGLTMLKGVVKHLGSEGLTIGSYTFQEIPFRAKNPIVPEVDPNTILLGHFFFENNLCPDYSITREQLEKCNAKFMLLGHDHEPHAPLTFGSTELLRQGSICRNTAFIYQFNRVPTYIQFSIDKDFLSYKVISLDVDLDVFIENLKPVLDKNVLLESMDLSIDFDVSFQSLKMSEALESVGADNEIQMYIKQAHENLNIIFN